MEGFIDIITVEHKEKMQNMQSNTIFGNIGNFDNEFDMNGLAKFEGVNVENIKLQVDRFIFPDGHGLIALVSGRLLNLGCATGHPAVVMPCSFTNLLAQLETGLQELGRCYRASRCSGALLMHQPASPA